MNKRLKDKWVKALRSGKYKQGKGKLLGPNNRFCCLGVLCDVSELGVWCDQHSYVFKGLPYSSSLPSAMATKVGLTDHQEGKLVDLNDKAGKSFEYIAYYIERYM